MLRESITLVASTLAAFAGCVPPAHAQTVHQSSACYRLTYDSIQPGFDSEAMPHTLVLRGATRGAASTEDSSSVWRVGAGNSSWWRARDSIFALLTAPDREYFMQLGQSGDTLKGWVVHSTDSEVAGRAHPRARLAAIPKRCEHA